MVLVFKDNQVLSVSRKKVICHEGMYAHFDPTKAQVPEATIKELDTKRDIESIQQDPLHQPPHEEDNTTSREGTTSQVKGVHSVKVLRDSTINDSMNEALPKTPLTYHSQLENQGESLQSLQMRDKLLDEDSLLEKLISLKEKAKVEADTQYQKIVKAIQNIRGKKIKSTSPADEEFGADISAKNILNGRRDLKERKRKAEIQIGNKVRIKTIHFGKKYAKDRPEYTDGKVVAIKGKKVGVRYDGGDEIYDTYLSRLEKLEDHDDPNQENVVATICYNGKWYKRSQTVYTIMATLEVGCA
jgi:hypothetical protein